VRFIAVIYRRVVGGYRRCWSVCGSVPVTCLLCARDRNWFNGWWSNVRWLSSHDV